LVKQGIPSSARRVRQQAVFGCEIPEEAADSMFTVGGVVKFLETNAKS
jgi:hypothetical protein